MPKKVKPYAFKHYVTVQPVDPAQAVGRAWYWVVTNLNSEIYDCTNLRQLFGLWPESEIRTLANNATIVTVNSQVELCRMGICGEISCTIRANDATVFYPAFGVEHQTTFLHDLKKSLPEVAAGLLNLEIKVGSDQIVYKVVPGTIKQKKRKATTPHLG